jgi:hypothetical protein
MALAVAWSCGGELRGGGDAGQDGGAGDANETVPPDAQQDSSMPLDDADDDGESGDSSMDDAPSAAGPDAADAGGEVAADASDAGTCPAPATLAATGLYDDFSTKVLAADVHAFDPGLHLWSDGLDKNRYISFPAGTQITTSGGNAASGGTMDEWVFPIGTRVWKEFVMLGTRIETRFMEKCENGSWIRTTYRWSADGQTSATQLTTGALLPNTAPAASGATYEIPRQDQCTFCHSGRVDNLLGFEAVALSWTGDSWASQATIDGVQAMSFLVTQGLLSQNPTSPIVIPGRNQTERDAFGWLHINCGVPCHNPSPNAFGRYAGLFMRLQVDTMATYNQTNTWNTAVNQPSLFQPIIGGVVQAGWNRITPGDPDHSTVFYRATTRDNGTTVTFQQMPPIVSHAIDGPDTAIVRSWITNASP